MPSRHTNKEPETIVPLGIVLIAIGLIIVLTVTVIWFLIPRQSPVKAELIDVQSSILPILPSPTSVLAIIVTPTPGPASILNNYAALLPETSDNAAQLPSFASLTEAPIFEEAFGESQPQRIVIPKLGIDATIRRVQLIPIDKDGHRYFQWQVPGGSEVGWHETSAPLGQPGNTVLNGHNNIYGEIFRDLIDLNVGEEIIVYDRQYAHIYQVSERVVLPENGQPLSVRYENARWIQPTDDERITIVTCWPYSTNSNRLVVIAKPVGIAVY